MSFFSEQLQKNRKKNKLTQQKLASLLNINRVSYARWETGAREPNLETVVKLAQILNITTDELLGQTLYSKVDWIPFEKLKPIDFQNFNKDELNILKHSIAVENAENKNLFELKDELVERWQLNKEESKILNSIFYEVQKYWDN